MEDKLYRQDTTFKITVNVTDIKVLHVPTNRCINVWDVRPFLNYRIRKARKYLLWLAEIESRYEDDTVFDVLVWRNMFCNEWNITIKHIESGLEANISANFKLFMDKRLKRVENKFLKKWHIIKLNQFGSEALK